MTRKAQLHQPQFPLPANQEPLSGLLCRSNRAHCLVHGRCLSQVTTCLPQREIQREKMRLNVCGNAVGCDTIAFTTDPQMENVCFTNSRFLPQLSCLQRLMEELTNRMCFSSSFLSLPQILLFPFALWGPQLDMHLLHLPGSLYPDFWVWPISAWPELSLRLQEHHPLQAKGVDTTFGLLLLSGTLISNGGSLMFYSWFYSYSYKWSLYKNSPWYLI